jgi:hypothetical protein
MKLNKMLNSNNQGDRKNPAKQNPRNITGLTQSPPIRLGSNCCGKKPIVKNRTNLG